MKIELKNTSFKYLFEFLNKITPCDQCGFDVELLKIRDEELKWQYERSFRKYQDEKQEFEKGDEVKFKDGIGRISNVYKRQNGKYYYVIKYIDFDYSDDIKTPYTRYSNPLTKKNLTKVKRKTNKNGNTTFTEII